MRDFRSRGIAIAFAMVGNRVDKTLRKANLKGFIGDNWFFATVHEAVVYCLRHQQAKRQLVADIDILSDPHAVKLPNPREDIGVLVGNEVGFSNDLHHDVTTIIMIIILMLIILIMMILIIILLLIIMTTMIMPIMMMTIMINVVIIILRL